MPGGNGRHLTIESREAIEEGLANGDSARTIAKRIGASPSTVTREVKANRTVREPKLPYGKQRSWRCAHVADCHRSGSACGGCPSRLTPCRTCKTRDCTRSCPDFELKMCPAVRRWPYVCPPGCPRRRSCGLPKCSYRAADAQDSYRLRLASSREGADISPEELAAMDAIVAPLVRRGQSFEAIWAVHGDELPVCARTAYNYQEAGLLSTADIELPRKVRLKPRRRSRQSRARVDRTGRTWDDFCALPLEDRARVVELDSVEGRAQGARDIFTLHVAAVSFQIFLLKEHADPAAVVAWLDVAERAMGSPEAFASVFGVLLADRGVEFDDAAGVERSCLAPGKRRCRLFWCDAMASNQKARAERNHQQLRRVLPKGRSDFDALSAWDVAVLCSHVNSYPLPGRGGRCAFELAQGLLPSALLDELGLARVPADEVTLRPSLLRHAVDM